MIITPLLKHQQKALDTIKGSCGIYMPFGSGKSLVALSVIESLGARRILITSDRNNIINTWGDQISRHTDYEFIVRPDNPLTFIQKNKDSVVCVCINYDLLCRRVKEYLKVDWDLWIGDESSEVKDQRTAKHKGTRVITSNIKNRLLLNGRIMIERLEDIYGQVVLLDEGKSLGRTLSHFRGRYMEEDSQGYGFIPRRSAFTRVRRDMAKVSYFMTPEEEASLKMPERIYNVVTVNMTPEQKRIDDELKLHFQAVMSEKVIDTKYAAVTYIKRIQVMGGIFRPTEETQEPERIPTEKLDVVKNIIQSNKKDKIIIWHTYIPETDLLKDYLTEQGIEYVVVDSPKCSDVLEKYRTNKFPKVALVRTSLCKGLNQLVGARIGVFYSNPLSYSRRAQAEGRTCRITSTSNDTHYFDIVCRNGTDQVVHHMLSQKKGLTFCLTNLRNLL